MFEVLVVDVVGGLGDGEYFGVGGWIVCVFDCVVSGCDDFVIEFDYVIDGDFVFVLGVDCLVVCEVYVECVVVD